MSITANTKSVNVARKDLIEKLVANLTAHKADYQEALVGYKIKLEQDLKKVLKAVKTATVEEAQTIRMPTNNPPQDHSKDYEEVIQMLQMSVDDVINLDSHSFKAFVMNEWAWSNTFNSTATMYKGIALSASGRV
jgi:allophanate hydrolase subunit 1